VQGGLVLTGGIMKTVQLNRLHPFAPDRERVPILSCSTASATSTDALFERGFILMKVKFTFGLRVWLRGKIAFAFARLVLPGREKEGRRVPFRRAQAIFHYCAWAFTLDIGVLLGPMSIRHCVPVRSNGEAIASTVSWADAIFQLGLF
jgi:hypothetical protein